MTDNEKSELSESPKNKGDRLITFFLSLVTGLFVLAVAWIFYIQYATTDHAQTTSTQSVTAAQAVRSMPVNPEQAKFQDAMNSAKENGFWNFDDAMASLKTAQDVNDSTLKNDKNDHAIKMLREHVLLTANISPDTLKRYRPGIDGLEELLSSPLTTKAERATLSDDVGLFFRIFSSYTDSSNLVKDQDFILYGRMAIAEGSKSPLVAMAVADGCFGKFSMNYSISVRPSDAGCVVTYASLAMTLAKKAGLKKKYGVSGSGPENAGDLEPFDEADALEKLFWSQASLGDRQGAEQTYNEIKEEIPDALNQKSGDEGGNKSYEQIFNSALKAIPKVADPPAGMISVSASTRL